MALSPYKNNENTINRSRSSSCSSPIRNRIVFQEIYSMGENTLVRSYSCDQVFDKDNSGQSFHTTQIHVSSFLTPDFKFRKGVKKTKEFESKPKKKLELPSKGINERTKKKRLKMVSDKRILNTTIKFTFFSLLSMYFVYLYLTYRECSYVWNLETTKNKLLENVFGQNEAVTKINSVLSLCNKSNDMFTMVFTGGVGVGKTYASSIISSDFPWSSSKLITFSDNFNVQELDDFVLLNCGCNLIIIDDLSAKSVLDGIDIVQTLSSARKRNEKMLVIMIFIVKSEMEQSQILKMFQNSYINFYHVPFAQLSKEVVRKCFEKEIQKQGTTIPKTDLDKLIEEKMSHVSVVKGATGCKGVADEVSTYLRKNYF